MTLLLRCDREADARMVGNFIELKSKIHITSLFPQ